MSNYDNVIPLKKADKFVLCRGTMGPDDELTEYEQVGAAYLKEGAKTFRLKLWMFPSQQFFLAPDNNNPKAYAILSLEEFQATHEKKVSWQKIGTGEFVGLHIKMKFHLLSEDVYLCLFPDEKQAEEFYAAG